jgi:hypothetical protein
MGLFSLFRFYEKTGEYMTPDPTAVEKAGELGERHATYHRRIVLVGGIFGAIGAALGLALSIGTSTADKADKDVKGILLAPLMFAAAGVLFGVAMACLFAPTEFLMGPVGRKWMKLIGTESVRGARLTCLIFGLVVMAPFVGCGLIMTLVGK